MLDIGSVGRGRAPQEPEYKVVSAVGQAQRTDLA
jgi:hypothetical protein